jgi:hypothetical protein
MWTSPHCSSSHTNFKSTMFIDTNNKATKGSHYTHKLNKTLDLKCIYSDWVASI